MILIYQNETVMNASEAPDNIQSGNLEKLSTNQTQEECQQNNKQPINKRISSQS